MKETIKRVLDRHKNGQGNMASESFRDMLANEIWNNIWADMEEKAFEEAQAGRGQSTGWTCSICGEDTSDVEYDYIGSGTNHLKCELEVEQESKNE